MATASQTKDVPAVALTGDQLSQIIGEVTKSIARAERPENQNAPPAFWNGYGLKGFPALTRRTFYCGALEHERQLSREEITLYNSITRSGEYGPGGTYRVRVRGNGSDGELHVSVTGVDTIEGRMGLPSLKTVLQTIVDEQAAVAV